MKKLVAGKEMAPAVGLEPRYAGSSDRTDLEQNTDKSKQISALPASAEVGQKQILASSGQEQDISEHSKRVPEEYRFPDDLDKVVAAWPFLSQTLKAKILAMVIGERAEG